MTADAWKAIDSRRNLKRKLIDAKSERLHERYQQQYSEADRKVKRLTRDDKRAHIAAKRDQQGTVYKITKVICGKYQANANTIIKDKQGSLLTRERERERERGGNVGRNISERF